ncbi:type IV pilus modification PilV family protein [Photobacterium atrarenae]|uniref:Prepilin-type N-terminal cleavage/methylation domain-containing protein n=1 Tax=Photobacterium atrarenae TaxID=865757 RepID=A0ABY5GDC4_9GAMM|nr:prepilin-type N-terminal cleavage/methylation domain-containing protein [Photobacterium atrarenae]UTV27196.1 prepilin-type N-terminal cleavage/methylation domain-containing protein [Photobacterium atrarenae]
MTSEMTSRTFVMKSRKQQGFSLIEVLVSVLVISFSLVAILKLQSYVELKSEQADLQIQAVRKAEQQLMLWQNVGAEVDCHGSFSTKKELTLANLETCLIDFSPLKGKVEVETVKTGPTSGVILFKKMKVTVQWEDREGQSGSVVLLGGYSAYSPLLM